MIIASDLSSSTAPLHGYPNASAFYDVPDARSRFNIGASFTYYYLAPDRHLLLALPHHAAETAMAWSGSCSAAAESVQSAAALCPLQVQQGIFAPRETRPRLPVQ